jgi:hypothetical protein
MTDANQPLFGYSQVGGFLTAMCLFESAFSPVHRAGNFADSGKSFPLDSNCENLPYMFFLCGYLSLSFDKISQIAV